jgi:hypothetical protein
MRNARTRPQSSGPLALLGLLLALPAGSLVASSPNGTANVPEPLARAFEALARQPAVAYTAHRRLEGELVNKGESAWMDVTTTFEPGRGLSHTVRAQGGSSRIRERALEKVLQKEIESACAEEARRAAYTRENYQYRLLDAPADGVRIELVPKREDVRLLKGTALVDPGEGPLRHVQGELAKNPSFWVRDVHMERTYDQVGGSTLIVELVSTARIRLFGEARLRIRTTYATVEGRPVD